MEGESSKETKISATVDAVAGVLKEIPVYQDALQPAAKQIGKSLETVAKTVNMALAPLKALVWGYDQIEDFVNKRVSEKLKNVPPENIIPPAPQIAGPAIEALRYAGHEENLRELYANLLATAMDKNTEANAHPGYVDIIKNLTPDEALLLTTFINSNEKPLIDILAIVDTKSFNSMYINHSNISKLVKLKFPKLTPNYIDNLCRLGILEIPYALTLIEENEYIQLENDPAISEIKKQIEENMKRKVEFNRKVLRLTNYGRFFVNNVVKEKA